MRGPFENMAHQDTNELTVTLLILVVLHLIRWAIADGRVAEDGPRALLNERIQIVLMRSQV